jgi:HlyD family secretion protein
MRSLILSAGAVCAVAAGLPLIEDRDPAAERAAVHPDVAEPLRMIFASGHIEGRGREIDLRFEVAGRLESLEVQEGALVRKGDVLARLDANALEHALAQTQARLDLALAERARLLNGASREARAVAEAEIAVAEVRAEQARKRFERAERLQEKNAISGDTYDNLAAEYERAEAELELAARRAAEVSAPAREDDLQMANARVDLERAQVRQAETLLERTVLRSPSEGVILKVRAEPGELRGLEAEQLEPIISLTDTSSIHVRAQVEELDAVRVRPGLLARVTVDGLSGDSFRGRIIFCSPYMIPKSEFSNRPGERVDVKVREVVIALDPDQPRLGELVIGLPVDVYLAPTDAATEAIDDST